MPSRVTPERANRYFAARQLGHDRTAACRIAHVSRGWAIETERRIRYARAVGVACPVCGCATPDHGTGHELHDSQA